MIKVLAFIGIWCVVAGVAGLFCGKVGSLYSEKRRKHVPLKLRRARQCYPGRKLVVR